MKTTWEDSEEELDPPATGRPLRERAACLETQAVLRQADVSYAPYGCPASGECCQLRTTGRPPLLWEPEWLLLERQLASEGRALPSAREDGGCPFLDAPGRRCTVYAVRPFGCRTFFCGRRTGPASHPREDVVRQSRRLEAVARQLDPDAAPLPLPEWWARAGGR